MLTRTASRLIALLTCLVGGALASANETRSITFPLEGHYRPGRFMPAVLASGSEAAAQQFYGAGILGVRVERAKPGTCVLAIPVLSRPELQFGGVAADSSPPAAVWREVPLEQVFLGLVDSGPAPRGLDVGPQPVASQLSRTLLLGSAASAWNALDWLVISPDAAAGLGDGWLGDLIAAGTGVCISGSSLPPGRLPWRAIEGGWALSAPSAGARLGPWAPEAYLPAQTWQPKQPPELRRQIVAVAVGMAGMALACALLKGRRRVVVAVVAAAGATAGVALWSMGAPAAALAQGRIVVVDDVVRADHWVFVGSLSGGMVRIPWHNGLTPIFASREQAANLSPQLIYDAGRPVGYECMLPAGQTLALRWQEVLPAVADEEFHALTPSPMRAVVEAYYLTPGWSLRGQLTSGEEWPPLVVAKRQ